MPLSSAGDSTRAGGNTKTEVVASPVKISNFDMR